MTLETLIRPQIARSEKLSPNRKESIFHYYSVPNEIRFANDFTERSPHQYHDARFYIRENVYRFLGEFAGNIPYASLSYSVGENDLEFAGIEMSSSYENTAKMGGMESREQDEWEGYKKIRKAFLSGDNSIVWISPPKTADYGFVFYFQRNPDDPTKIREYILEYDEKKGSVAESQKLLSRIDNDKSFATDSEFLRNPLSLDLPKPQQDLALILRVSGISEEKIKRSLQFEEKVRDELSVWVEQYVDAVFGGRVDDAKRTLTAIYNRADDIRKTLEEQPRYAESSSLADMHTITWDQERVMFDYYASREAKTSGGSCPVTKNNGWTGDPFSLFNVMKTLREGMSINGLLRNLSESFFECPRCNFHASGPVGNQCPNCGLTKEEHAKQGGEIC